MGMWGKERGQERAEGRGEISQYGTLKLGFEFGKRGK